MPTLRDLSQGGVQPHKSTHVSGGSDAFLSTDLLEAIIKRLQESGGPTTLTMGAVADGEYLKRSSSSIIGGTPSGLVPTGVICMWSGTLATIPSGWALCDGNNGTPNLVAKFIRGVNTSGTNPGTTGGADAITPAGTNSTPTFTGSALAGHQHQVPWHIPGGIACRSTASFGTGGSVAGVQAPSSSNSDTTSAGRQKTDSISAGTPAGTVSRPTFTGTQFDNRPAYYELAYIMKL